MKFVFFFNCSNLWKKVVKQIGENIWWIRCMLNITLFSGMENVAEHINEMQRIHEEYGAIFDHLYRQYQRSTSQLHELNPGDLLYYGGVEWLNISGFLGKIKKGLELHAMCFIFRTAVVFLCKERLRSKRKQLLVSPLIYFANSQ